MILRAAASLGLLVLAGSASAQPSTPAPGLDAPAFGGGAARVEARLVADVAAAVPGEPFLLALRQDIAPGWHTYWRNPGDSGAPTSWEPALPEGSAVGGIAWPAPEALPYQGLMNFGYEDGVLLAREVALPDDWPAGVPVVVTAEASWLVCADICVPESASLELLLDTALAEGGPPTPSEHAALFEQAAAGLPRPSPFAATFDPDGDGWALRLEGPLGAVEGARFFPFEPGLVEAAAEQPLMAGPDGLTLSLTPLEGAAPPAALEGVLRLDAAEGTPGAGAALTVSAEARAAPLVQASPAGAGLGGNPAGFAAALGLALLGGLALNLMPCVLPVLSLKALRLARASPGAARAEGLSYAAGVVATFLALGGLLVALKATGSAIGWGFQLQEPLVVAGLALLTAGVGFWLLAGLNLGVGLAAVAGNADVKLARASAQAAGGGSAQEKPGNAGTPSSSPKGGRARQQAGSAWKEARGSFLTGALAVALAAPCTAPFMAGATGWALAASAPQALAVFAALGLGLALPALALGLAPGAGKFLPKPGPWTERLRQFLAFPLFATAAWLLWVLSVGAGPAALLWALMGLVALGLAAWLAKLAEEGARPKLARGGALAALALALALPAWPLAGALPSESPSAAGAGGSGVTIAPPAEPWSPERLAELEAQNRPALVNMTAAWCLTCLVNERAALSGQDFEDALEAAGAAYLKGDWTRQDPAISAYLERFGRAGVPLYAVHPANGGEPELLPQLLTPAIVEAALERAKG